MKDFNIIKLIQIKSEFNCDSRKQVQEIFPFPWLNNMISTLVVRAQPFYTVMLRCDRERALPRFLPNCRRLMGILPPLHCILGLPQKAIEEYKRRNIENIASKDHRKLSPFLFFYGKIAGLFHIKALIRWLWNCTSVSRLGYALEKMTWSDGVIIVFVWRFPSLQVSFNDAF